MSILSMMMGLVRSDRRVTASPPPPPPPPPFSISINHTSLTATRQGNGSVSLGPVVLTPTNPFGIVNYTWTRQSGSTAFTPTAPTSATTSFTASLTVPQDVSAVWRGRGTDDLNTDYKDITIRGICDPITHVVTEGSNGTNYGYNDGVFGGVSYGSVAPAAYAAATIRYIVRSVITVKGTTSYTFTISMAGNRAQGFFTSVNISGFGVLNSADATHSYSASDGGVTTWFWSNTNVTSLNGSGTTSMVFS